MPVHVDLPYDTDVVRKVNKVLIVLVMVCVMFSMGCDITFKDMRHRFKRPTGIVLGLLCQFGFMPLLALAIRHLLSLTPQHALGLIIVATCPGGSLSNLFTYWCKADVALSVSMTAVSTLAALGLMPLNLYLYEDLENYHLPYTSIFLALALAVIPVLVGMAIRHKWEKVCAKITKVGSIVGMIGIACAATLQVLQSPHTYLATWRPYVACALLPASGAACGYLVSSASCQPQQQRRAISIETGCQNAALAIEIVLLSFPGEEQNEVAMVPLLFGLISSAVMVAFTCLCRGCLAVGWCEDEVEGVEERPEYTHMATEEETCENKL